MDGVVLVKTNKYALNDCFIVLLQLKLILW